MNALHQAVTRAIADARGAPAPTPGDADYAAAVAAVGVCFAEAQHAVEGARERAAAEAANMATGDGEAPGPPLVEDYAMADAVLGVALAALAALAEDEA